MMFEAYCALEDVVALAADGQDLDRLALAQQPHGMLARKAGDRGVEAAGKAALAGRNDEQMDLVLARAAEQRGASARPA